MRCNYSLAYSFLDNTRPGLVIYLCVVLIGGRRPIFGIYFTFHPLTAVDLPSSTLSVFASFFLPLFDHGLKQGTATVFVCLSVCLPAHSPAWPPACLPTFSHLPLYCCCLKSLIKLRDRTAMLYARCLGLETNWIKRSIRIKTTFMQSTMFIFWSSVILICQSMHVFHLTCFSYKYPIA